MTTSALHDGVMQREPLNTVKIDGANGGTQHPPPEDDGTFHLAHEAWKLLYISLPAVAVQFSVRFAFPQTASSVGRVLGTLELAAFSLGSLTANLTCLSILMGALTAAETLMPRAYGGERYARVGHLAVQGFVVCAVLLLLPIIPLCTCMEWIFRSLGQDPQVSKLASQWIRIYLLAVPSMLIFRVTQAFCNSQHVVLPLVFGSAISTFLVHPLMLNGIVPTLGLEGSALCLAFAQFVMIVFIFLYLYIRPEHNPQTWPGLSRVFVREALQPGPLWNFVKLSLGGVLSLSVSALVVHIIAKCVANPITFLA